MYKRQALFLASAFGIYNIEVATSDKISENIPVIDPPAGMGHGGMFPCVIQSTRSEGTIVWTEDIKQVVHGEAVYLELEYADPPIILGSDHTSTTLRAITSRSDEYDRGQINVSPEGHTCFRWDSFGSILSVAKGLPTALGTSWKLGQGRYAPAMATDSDIRARVYCYGTLTAANKQGPGKIGGDKMPEDESFNVLRSSLRMGCISVLHATGFKSGPRKSGQIGQWSMNGFLPTAGYLKGVILTPIHDKTIHQLMITAKANAEVKRMGSTPARAGKRGTVILRARDAGASDGSGQCMTSLGHNLSAHESRTALLSVTSSSCLSSVVGRIGNLIDLAKDLVKIMEDMLRHGET